MFANCVLLLLALYTCEAFQPFPVLPWKHHGANTRAASKAADTSEETVDFVVGSLCEFNDGKGHVFVGKV